MSEGGGEALGPPFANTGGFQSSQPPTPSSTVPDAAGTDPNSKSSSSSGLPPFSSFSATELAEGLGSRLGPEGFGTETYTGRLLDFPSWGYYDEGLSGRLLDRGDGLPMLIPQPQYRPWESKPMDSISQDGFTKNYDYPGSPASKLPSFQSQFNAFPDQNGETISLTTLTPAPPSPTTNNSGLPSFHTLSTVTVNPRGYPLVPAPVQAREIPTIQQQFLDERHIHLFQSPTTLNNAQYHQLGLTSTNPGIIQGNFVTHPQPPQQATLLTVVKTEPVAIVTTQLHQQPHVYQNSNTVMDHESVKVEESSSSPRGLDSRKKERRKIRASSMDSSVESDGVGSSSVESSGQVAAISSTASFKSPLMQHQNLGSMNMPVGGQHGENEECENGTGEKQTKKKRKRCGECIGCQRKDNCGDCAPCRNDKSHQICKMRRCEKLTDKKHLLYLTNDFPRTESRRGRGKGTRASYRNKGGRGGSNANQNQGPPTPQQASSSSGTVTPQPTAHSQSSSIVALNGNDPSPNPTMMTTADHSPGSVMPFYGSNIPTGNVTETTPGFPQAVREHRFPNAVWQQTAVPADAAAMSTWPPQGQFIQQLPPPQIEELRYHPQYPPSAPVTVSSYTQSAPGYQPTQTGFLQTNGPPYQTSQPPAASPLLNGGTTTRSNSTVNGTIDYVDASPRPTEYMNGAYPGQESTLVPQPSSTPNSRCSSVHNLDSNTSDSVSGGIPPSKTPTTVNNYIQPIGTPSQVTNQGNAMPGYPPQQPPQSQQSLHNSSGYPGQNSQSVTHRFMGEDIKQSYHGNMNENKQNNTPKEWGHQEQVSRKDQGSNTWPNTSVAGDEKHNQPIYQSSDTSHGNYRAEDRTNVNNKLKTMILSKQHSNQNQNHFQSNQNYHQNQDNQFSQKLQQQHNQQFCSATPPPMSPAQHQIPLSPSQNMQLSSQHFQFNNQNRNTPQSQMQQAQMQSSEQLHHQQRQQQFQQQMQQQQMQQTQQQQMQQSQQQMQQNQQQQMQQSQQQMQQSQQQMQQTQQQQMQQSQQQQMQQSQQQQMQQSQQQQMQQTQQQMQQSQQQQLQQQTQQAYQMQHQQMQHEHHQMQHQQMHQQEQKQFTHQMQQQMHQQQMQMHHQMQQNQHMQPKTDSSPKHFYENQNKRVALDKNLVSPRHEMSPSYQQNVKQESYQQVHQQHPQKQFIDNYGNKSQMNNSNFLAQGHHPRSLVTEGGGFWDFSPTDRKQVGKPSAIENFVKYATTNNEQRNFVQKSNFYYPVQNFIPLKETKNAIATQTVPIDGEKNEIKIEKTQKNETSNKSNFRRERVSNFGQQTDVSFWEIGKEMEKTNSESNDNQTIKKEPKENPEESTWYNHKILLDDRRPKSTSGEQPRAKTPFGEDPRTLNDCDPNKHVFTGEGGPKKLDKIIGSWCCRKGGTETPTEEHLKNGCCSGTKTMDEILDEDEEESEKKLKVKNEPVEEEQSRTVDLNAARELRENIEKLKNNIKTEVPECDCFPSDKFPPEPGSYYTQLGAASSLPELRDDLERRTGHKGNALRFEKLLYTGKEGKTTQGCPLAKWILRRSSPDEKMLVLVKHRPGHKCPTAWIVVIVVAWEGVPVKDADLIYNMLVHKLNKFGLPTLRRCATNEPRTCACQGLDPETCGASFSFGCSWSMYYNGCKYARSKTVRKFRLSVRSEEQEVEERINSLATHLSPLYEKVAPRSYQNMTQFEQDASECRLGSKGGRPFSGVTACVDFCAHAHRDMHNMNNGCTTVVTLSKHKGLSKPDDEQLHVLPLYMIDDTDEFGDKESQLNKIRNGSLEVLSKFPCEVRVRSVPLQPCRRHGKKRKEEDNEFTVKREPNRQSPACDRLSRPSSVASDVSHGFEGIDSQLQSSQVSSTVLDSPVYQGWNFNPIGQNVATDSQNNLKNNWYSAQVSQQQFSSEWQNISSTAPDSITSWSNIQSDADSTTINSRSSSTLSAADPTLRNQFAINQSKPFTSPSPSPMSYSRTSTPVSNRTSLSGSQFSTYSPSNMTDWGISDNNESWEFSSPMTPLSRTPEPHRASPFPGNRTPIRQSPNLQSPSVDSYHSRSPSNEPNFLKPYPPDKVDETLSSPGLSQHYRNNKREFEDKKNFKSPAKTESSPAKTKDVKYMDKGTTVDVNLFKGAIATLPYQNQVKQEPNRFWPGDDITPFGDSNSSPNPANSFVPINNAYGYTGSSYSFQNLTDVYGNQFNAQNRFGERSTEPNQQFVKNEDKSPCFSGSNSLNFQFSRWEMNSSAASLPSVPESPKTEPLGEILDYVDNEECFNDPQMGGVAIALNHGSVLFECAKHELHSTTALKKPNRRQPSRLSLVFYQHRNLNRPKHGWEEWEEKTRLKKLGITTPTTSSPTSSTNTTLNSSPTVVKAVNLHETVPNVDKSLESSQFMLHTSTFPTITWTTLFPMHPCITSGPYKDKKLTDVR